jgi:phenylalanyl-tRNA synthetase beta chain
VNTVGKQVDFNNLTEHLRQEIAKAGYKECLNFALNNMKENTTNLNLTDDSHVVTIANSKTIDFQAGRTNLLSGLLKTMVSNKSNKLPLELFEVSDVVLKADTETGAKNERRMAAVRTNVDSAELSVSADLPRKSTDCWTMPWLS